MGLIQLIQALIGNQDLIIKLKLVQKKTNADNQPL